MNIKLGLSLAVFSMVASCAVTPERARSRGVTDIQVIQAPLPAVAACIAGNLKETTSHDVIEENNSVIAVGLGNPIRIYDLENVTGGTMVTLYARNLSVYETQAKLVIEYCRIKLATPK